MGDQKLGGDKKPGEAVHTEPPGSGDTIDDAAREAVEEIRKSGNDHAGTGDGG